MQFIQRKSSVRFRWVLCGSVWLVFLEMFENLVLHSLFWFSLMFSRFVWFSMARLVLVRFVWFTSVRFVLVRLDPSSNFITIRPLGAELFHADARTDGHNEANFAYALKNGCINPLHILSGFQYTIAVADF